MNRPVEITIFFGWIVGAFPSQNPFISSPKFGFKWATPAAFYSILLGGVLAITNVDLSLSNRFQGDDTPLTSKIVQLATEFLIYGTEFLIRVVFLLEIRRCIRLLKNIFAIHGVLGRLSVSSVNSECMRSVRIFRRRLLTAMLSSFAVHFVGAILRLTSNYLGFFWDPCKWKYVTLPDNPWLRRIVFGLSDLSAYSVIYFASIFIVVIGLAIVELHRVVCAALADAVVALADPQSASISGKTASDEVYYDRDYILAQMQVLVLTFNTLKGVLNDFNEIIGGLAVPVIIGLTITIVHQMLAVGIHGFESQLSAAGVACQIPSAVGIIAAVVAFGGFLNKEFHGAQVQLRRSCVACQDVLRDGSRRMNIFVCEDDFMRKLAKEIAFSLADWSWTLSAGGFFQIDTKLICFILEGILTYFIFLLQLRTYEPSTAHHTFPI